MAQCVATDYYVFLFSQQPVCPICKRFFNESQIKKLLGSTATSAQSVFLNSET